MDARRDRLVDASLWLMAFGTLFLVAFWSFFSAPPGGTPFPDADKAGVALAVPATRTLQRRFPQEPVTP